MVTIDIKVLRESLSEYIVRARGRTHHHHRPCEEVAELVPLRLERRGLMRLVVEGKITFSGAVRVLSKASA